MTSLPELSEDDCQDPEFTELFVDVVTDRLSDISSDWRFNAGDCFQLKGTAETEGECVISISVVSDSAAKAESQGVDESTQIVATRIIEFSFASIFDFNIGFKITTFDLGDGQEEHEVNAVYFRGGPFNEEDPSVITYGTQMLQVLQSATPLTQ